jgi:hypothetical protein
MSFSKFQVYFHWFIKGVKAMDRSNNWSKSFLTLAVLLFLVFAAACAEVRLNTIPAPPPTAKLRIFVHPVSGPAAESGWGRPHEEWARRQVNIVRRFLREKGIYKVPSEEEIAYVVGKKTFSSWDWKRKDWSLVRQVGQALHSDYAMIMERTVFSGFKYFETVLINVETGKRFKVLFRIKADPSTREEWRQINRVAYNEIFRNAKNDMLATAIRRGRLAAPEFFGGRPPILPPPPTKPVPAPLPPSSTVAKPAVPPVPRMEEKPSMVPEISKEVDYDEVLSAEEAARGRTNLAVYDLDTI